MRTLKEIVASHRDLIFQNDGYEYLQWKDESRWAANKAAIEEITALMKSKCANFVEFFNFKVGKSKASAEEVMLIRFNGYYDKHAGFVGVYYIPVDEVDSWPTLEEIEKLKN